MQTEGRTIRTCEVSADLAKRLNVLDDLCCRLWVGTKPVWVRLAVNPDLDSSTLAVPRGVQRDLSIWAGLKTNVTRAGLDLRLGPVVGVFVNPIAAARAARGSAGFRLVELVKANQKAGCIPYVFSSADVAWSPPRARGSYYDERRNEWRRRSFPLPDVLYDRGGGFKSMERPLANYIRRQLWSIPGLKKFNGQHYFDKWDQYRRLMRHAPLCRHLPDTVLYAESADLAAMLNKHGCVYIKSTLGSNGRAVMRVIAGEGGYAYDYCRTEIVRGSCPDLASLETVVRDFLGRQSAVIQAGIDLLTYNDAKIDLRALVARDARGAWGIVDIPVRVARGDCAITSTRSGSTVHRFWEFFRTALLYDEDRLRKVRKRIAKIVYLAIRAIEAEYGNFGELGIDLGIDKRGKIWFIEANAKPGKDTIRLAGDPIALAKAFLLPLQYCRMLAGFTDAEGGVETARIRTLKSKTKIPAKELRPHPKHKRPLRHGRSLAGLAKDHRLRVPAPTVLLPCPDLETMMGELPQGPKRADEIALDRRVAALSGRVGPKAPVQATDGGRRPEFDMYCRNSRIPGTAHACFYTGKSAAITRAVTTIAPRSMTVTYHPSTWQGSRGALWANKPACSGSAKVWHVNGGTKTYRWPREGTVSDADD